MENYPVHPAAELFPLMGEAELKELAADIRAGGLIEAIELHHSRILDGRNRLLACKIAGVTPRFIEAPLGDGSPLQYVVSKNLHRRQLSTSQRAAIGAELKEALRLEAAERQLKGKDMTGMAGGRGRRKNLRPKTTEGFLSPAEKREANERRSSNIAARLMNVGATAINLAQAVRKADPVEFERCRRGQTTVSKAYMKAVKGMVSVREAKPEAQPAPREVPAAAAAYNKRRAVTAKNRMIMGLSHIRGLTRGLAEIRASLLLNVLDREEVKTWTKIAHECASRLRGFEHALKAGAEKDRA